ncbi:MAG: Spx/MgsR family RNA polymerase-binding regulatory protein [Acaryochloridaceae cyanobacterium SU_2_1]|nr:Spx/MgsR family RNA polymerase-binding regulatory protein [Acaryochloridaceae cyanobacterium SU_2_1]NJM95620.1 Spx/MgsR family RNA polymerase-binding regulatory protein [Acaryochloridaceae cyanobacterium CSU_5_19]
MTLQVYGIPNCGTCKKALQWLEAKGVAYEFINTKEHPPQTEQIKDWIEVFGSQALRNTSGGSYRALGEEKKTWSDQQWLVAFSQDAMLLKRPVMLKAEVPVLVGFRETEAVRCRKLGL